MHCVLLVCPDYLRADGNIQCNGCVTEPVDLDGTKRGSGSCVRYNAAEETMVFDLIGAGNHGCEIERIDIPAVAAVTELQAPQSRDGDGRARLILNRAHIHAAGGIICVDRTIAKIPDE